MKFNLNSGLFNCLQPCCYWAFQDYLESVERDETEYRMERADELVDIPERGQPWLAGLGIQGKTAALSVRRKNLLKDHLEYQAEEQCVLDWTRAKELVSEQWLKAFQETVGWAYNREHRKNKIKVYFKSVWSPKEYNFSTDQSDFILEIPKTEVNRIIKTCLLDNREGFITYLEKYHTSRDGYWSWMSNYIGDYERYWAMFKAGKTDSGGRVGRIEHVVWAALDYWLFGIDSKAAEMFENRLWDLVVDCDFSEAMQYEPIELGEAV